MTKLHDELLESIDDVARRLFAAEYPERSFDAIKPLAKLSWFRAAWNTRPAHPQAGEVVADFRPNEFYGLKPGETTPQPLYAHPQPHAEDDAELREGIEAAIASRVSFRRGLGGGMGLQGGPDAADDILKLISAARRDDQGGA